MLLRIGASRKGHLPNLIVIGAMKCGTTSLHYYLNLHPQISMLKEKESNFFVNEDNWNRGVEWYKSHFTGEVKVYGESSPRCTYYPFLDGAPERMYSVIPEAKLIYILRDPIERIISHYVHDYAHELEDRTIAEALACLDHNPYVCRSSYYMQLSQYLEYFAQSNILILTLEDLHRQPKETMQKVFRFLEVDDSFDSPKFSIIKHNSRYKRRKNRIGRFLAQTPLMNMVERLPFRFRGDAEILLFFPFSRKIERPALDGNLRRILTSRLQEDVNRLRQFTGYDFKDWCL